MKTIKKLQVVLDETGELECTIKVLDGTSIIAQYDNDTIAMNGALYNELITLLQRYTGEMK